MKEIIEKLKADMDTYKESGIIPFYVNQSEAQTIVTAFKQLAKQIEVYQSQVDEIERILTDNDLTTQERNELTAVKIKLQSVIQDLTKLIG